MKKNLKTYAQNTWCPGCGNFGIELAFKEAINELITEEKIKKEDIVIVTGIGCHAKIADYLNLNSFYSLHGRVLAPATGIKIANPNLVVIGFAGDGDAYGEGLDHLIFAAKRNINLTMIVHNNRVFALTTGQFTPTSPYGFAGKSTPQGSEEEPFNPLELMLASGATFIARGFSGNPSHLKEIIKEAILHQGFSFIDVLQPCVSFYDTYDFYRQRVYDLKKEGHNYSSWQMALEKIKEWNYLDGEKEKIPIGIFYKIKKNTFEENIFKKRNVPRTSPINLKEILKKHL